MGAPKGHEHPPVMSHMGHRPVAVRRRPSRTIASAAAVLVAVLLLGVAPSAAVAEEPPAPPPLDPFVPVIPVAPVAPVAPVVPPGPVFATGPLPVAGTITLYGRGAGHGVGLSQYGARGRALAGQDAATILGHYYPGTTLAPIDLTTQVRVLLASGIVSTATSPARVIGLNGPWSIDGAPGPFPAGSAVTIVRVGTVWQATIVGPDGAVVTTFPTTGDLRIRPAAPETRLQVAFKRGPYNVYRGVIRLTATTRVSAINELAMDDYLLGVVPVEMSYLWPAEALKSQAIAARTYALKRLHPTVGRWDVYDDTRSQVYRGSKAERASVTAAVSVTAGLVLRLGAGVANTPFHSAGGGATENNEFVWTRADGTVIAKPCPELRGSSDRAPDGTSYDATSPATTWKTATYSIDAFSALMAADTRTSVGIVMALDLSRRGISGRLMAVTLIGTAGTRTVSGSVFQSVFNARRPSGHPLLRSTLIDLTPIP